MTSVFFRGRHTKMRSDVATIRYDGRQREVILRIFARHYQTTSPQYFLEMLRAVSHGRPSCRIVVRRVTTSIRIVVCRSLKKTGDVINDMIRTMYQRACYRRVVLSFSEIRQTVRSHVTCSAHNTITSQSFNISQTTRRHRDNVLQVALATRRKCDNEISCVVACDNATLKSD